MNILLHEYCLDRFLTYVQNRTAFIGLSLLLRIIQSVGLVANDASAFTLITIHFPDSFVTMFVRHLSSPHNVIIHHLTFNYTSHKSQKYLVYFCLEIVRPPSRRVSDWASSLGRPLAGFCMISAGSSYPSSPSAPFSSPSRSSRAFSSRPSRPFSLNPLPLPNPVQRNPSQQQLDSSRSFESQAFYLRAAVSPSPPPVLASFRPHSNPFYVKLYYIYVYYTLYIDFYTNWSSFNYRTLII
jgi:hypothetical protein